MQSRKWLECCSFCSRGEAASGNFTKGLQINQELPLFAVIPYMSFYSVVKEECVDLTWRAQTVMAGTSTLPAALSSVSP